MHVSENAKCLDAENGQNTYEYKKRITAMQPLKSLRISLQQYTQERKRNKYQTGIIGMRAVESFAFDEVFRDEEERLLGPV